MKWLRGSEQITSDTYRGTKVMPNLMCKSNVRNLGGHMRAIVLDSDDSSVQRLLLTI